MKKQRLKIVKLLLVVLFISYYFETTLFYHTHYFSWGSVTHSHPYIPASGGTPGHTHSADECQTIALLSVLTFAMTSGIAAFFNNTVASRLYIPVFRPAPIRRTDDFSLRGPPVFIC